MRVVRIVPPDQRTAPDEIQAPGVTREVLLSEDGLDVQIVRTAPGMTSPWHHHGAYDSYVFLLDGEGKLEYGPNGAETPSGGPGTFVAIPKHTVHRESNPGEEESVAIVFRVGKGKPLFVVDGPEAGGSR